MNAEPMEDDPSYQEWITEISKNCTCCPDCWDVPCGGVQQGDICDNHCHCDDRLGEYWEEERC